MGTAAALLGAPLALPAGFSLPSCFLLGTGSPNEQVVNSAVPSLAMRWCNFLGIICDSRRGVATRPAQGPSAAQRRPHAGDTPALLGLCLPSSAQQSRRPQHPGLRERPGHPPWPAAECAGPAPGTNLLPPPRALGTGTANVPRPWGATSRLVWSSPGSCAQGGAEGGTFRSRCTFCFTASAPLSPLPRQTVGTSLDLLQVSLHPDFPAVPQPCLLPKVPGSPGEPLSFLLEAGRAGGCPAVPSPNEPEQPQH